MPEEAQQSFVVRSALRDATKESHRMLDESLLIAKPGSGLRELSHHLRCFHAWLEPVNRHVWRRSWPTELDARARLLKTEALERDLDALGVSPLSPVRFSWPDDEASVLGIAYVIEGSTLGGQHLARWAEQVCGYRSEYFHCYGERCAELWRTLLTCLEQELEGEALDVAIHAANQCFARAKLWMGAHVLH